MVVLFQQPHVPAQPQPPRATQLRKPPQRVVSAQPQPLRATEFTKTVGADLHIRPNVSYLHK